MFSGIVEKTSRVIAIKPATGYTRYTIAFGGRGRRIKKGESIAVNGACLTVSGCSKNNVSFDVIGQTISCTNLGKLKKGDRVNMERALKIGDRLDGHFVTGHIDCTVPVEAIDKKEKGFTLTLPLSKSYRELVIEKGSIALDGISLTVAKRERTRFQVCIIPHTLKSTNLHSRRAGDLVNVEFDLIGKFLRELVRKRG